MRTSLRSVPVWLAAASLAAVSLAAVTLTGCFELPSPPPPRDASPSGDAAAGLHVVSVTALDARGAARPLDAMPRAPRVVLELSAPLASEPELVVLVAGMTERALRDDLASTPFRSDTLARVVACEREVSGTTIELRPLAPLAPGAMLHVAIAAWARDTSGKRLGAPFVQALRVDDGDGSGARAVSTWPPDGATAVAPSLPLAAVRFDGAVAGLAEGLWLEGPGGERVPAVVRAARCDEVGWPGAHCAVIAPSRGLTPGALHTLRSDGWLIDATGASVPAIAAAFETAREPDREPPHWLTPSCALDEEAALGACVLADDARIVLRIRASEPVRLRLALGERTLAADVAPRGEAELTIDGLAPSTSLPATLEAIDLAGHTTRLALELATTEPLAPVSIVEVRADPWGAEPRQEYVEILSYGESTLDLAGFSISDAPGSIGDVIAGPARIAPGARALLVAEGFDPDDRGPGDRDVAVPPGVTLIRLDRSIASGGISNAGEPLFLRDPSGRRVSAAPAEPPPRPGVCTVRVASDPRTGARGSFDYDAGGGCTPGR